MKKKLCLLMYTSVDFLVGTTIYHKCQKTFSIISCYIKTQKPT